VVERIDRRTVGKQIKLPFSKALEISVKSLQIRFWRSLITVAGIVLAIAFLMSILTTNAVQGALAVRSLEPVPFGGELVPGLGDTGYEVGEDGQQYRVVRERDPVTGRLKTVGSPVPVTDPDGKEKADNYIKAETEWRTTTNNLKMKLITKGVLSEGTEQVKEGIQPKEWWLIILSLTVAVIGIVNAMLMSVAERYREIGTMKCLGALDGFIIRLFLLESVFQGTAGTIAGAFVGFLLTFLYSLLAFGPMVLWTFPGLQLFGYGCISVLIGFLLSVLGAILPAYRAAKMQPVDAMRVEE
jgi:ABC-type antimicrobial peptide transport system permease subunit